LKPYQIIQCRTAGFLVLLFSLFEFSLASFGTEEIVSAIDGEWEKLAMVTGVHSLAEPKTGFQLRVIEANGRVTVAINPITLYLVVTNDSSAGDLQQHIWRLPVTVGRVKRVAAINSGVRITAVLEAMPDANVKASELNFLARYKVENGILRDTITVQRDSGR